MWLKTAVEALEVNTRKLKFLHAEETVTDAILHAEHFPHAPSVVEASLSHGRFVLGGVAEHHKA